MSELCRRQWLAGLAAGIAGALVPKAALAAGSKILLLGGSSMNGVLGKELESVLGGAGYAPHRRGKGSSGLARPDFFDWPREGKRLHGVLSPRATVVMFGGNDGQGLFMGKKADQAWIPWGEPGWDEEYRRRVEALAAAVAPAGEHLLWMGMPVIRPPKLRTRVLHLNAIFEATMAGRDNWHYVDTWPLLADANGQYVAQKRIGGKVRTLRADDGVHLSGAGAHVLAEHVLGELRARVAAT